MSLFICPLARVLHELHYINRFSASGRSCGNTYLPDEYRFTFKPDYCPSAAVFHEKK